MENIDILSANEELKSTKLVKLIVPPIVIKQSDKGIFEDPDGKIIKEIQVPSEIKSLFTESKKPVEIYKDKETVKIVYGREFYDRAWLIWDMSHKIMAGRTLKQKLGDISTDFFLEKFTDSSYANYFKDFYIPLSNILKAYANDYGLRIPEDICLFYKGGNLFRILLTHFVQFLDNPEYEKLMKNRSDADFQIFINPNLICENRTYKEIVEDVSIRVLYILYKYRETLSKNGLIKHNTAELVPQYIQKIQEYKIPLDREKVKIASKINKLGLEEEKSYRSDFIMNSFEINNKIDKIAYTEEYSLLKNNAFFKIDKRIVDPSLYISRNITNDFTTSSGKRYLFELIRLKRNIRIEVFPENEKSLIMSVPSELIDVSMPLEGDDSLETMKNDINTYIQLYNYNESFQFYGVTLDYLLYDLSDILFLKFDWPWEDPKYEKRFTRYFICLLLYTVVSCYSKKSGCNIKISMTRMREDANIIKKYLETYNPRNVNENISMNNTKVSEKYLQQIFDNCKYIVNYIANNHNKDRSKVAKEFNNYRLKLLDLVNTLVNMLTSISEKVATTDKELKSLYETLFIQRKVNILGGKNKRITVKKN